MNKKILKGALAGTAVVAIAAGGGTWASWSDWNQIAGNNTAAGHLKLDLNSSGTISNQGATAIAPGQFRTIDYMVASSDLDGVPSADLSMKFQNLVDHENGCGSSNSEQAVDNCAAGDPGEFSSQGYVRIRYTDPAPVANIGMVGNECKVSGGSPLFNHSIGYTPSSDNDATHYPRLGALANVDNSLGTLTGNQGVCVRVDLGLDPSATDAVQTDSTTFDLRFDLKQHF